VTDEDNAATLVTVSDILVPGADDIAITESYIPGHGRACQSSAESGERDLAIHRRVKAAHGGEAGELIEYDVALFRLDRHGCVETGIFGDGGINVETIDGGVRVGVESFFCRGAIGSNDGGVEIDGAGVLVAGEAKPVRVVGVIDKGCRNVLHFCRAHNGQY